MENKISRLQAFYQKEKALVTSPFITQDGHVNVTLLTRVFERLGFEAADKILIDVGCGSGLLTFYFTDVARYVGLDIVRHPQHAGLKGEKKLFLQSDAQHIPIMKGAADRIVCLDSFEHYPDQNLAAREFYRILKPGGALFLSVPTYANVAGLVKKVLEKNGHYAQNTWAPFDYWKPEELEHFVTPSRIKNIFSDAGFSAFQKIGYDQEVAIGLCPWIWHPRMPRRLGNLIARCFAPVKRPIVAIWPAASLHTFWKMSKS